MKLVPLFDKVVLEKEKMEETTKSGIVLPGQDDKEKTRTGCGYCSRSRRCLWTVRRFPCR